MTASAELVEQLIDNQQQAIRYYVYYAVGLIVLGLLVMGISAAVSDQILTDVFKSLFGLGGAFVSSLSAFQVKEIVGRRNTILTLRKCKVLLIPSTQAPSEEQAEARKQIDAMVWRAVEKAITGPG